MKVEDLKTIPFLELQCKRSKAEAVKRPTLIKRQDQGRHHIGTSLLLDVSDWATVDIQELLDIHKELLTGASK